MSGRPATRRLPSGPSPDRRDPFGAAGFDAGHDAAMSDALRRARWVAVDLGADRFTLFLRLLRRQRPVLVPSLDADYPAVSVEARRLSSLFGEDLATRAAASTLPLWWSRESASDAPRSLGGLIWPERLTIPMDSSAIAFPVHSDRGQLGLVVFFRPSVAIDETLLVESHGRCFALFNALIRTSAADKSGVPAITPRELDCLRLTADGHTSQAIARLLGLSEYTANDHLTSASRKLNAVTRTHAVAKALRLGLIE